MKIQKLLASACLGFCGMGATSLAQAAPIFVNNFSFEMGTLPFSCGTGCAFSNDGSIPGWTASPLPTTVIGQFQPGPTPNAFFNSIPDGITIAFSNGGSLSQTVGVAVQAGHVYQLLVDQGVRKDVGDPGFIQLVIGSTPILATGVAATPGNWSTYTATYVATAADVGKSISIVLTSTSAQGDWDNVRLNDTITPLAIPEPASLALAGLALTALGLSRRKVKKA